MTGPLAESLVREYLHRSGLEETLSALDRERPRGPDAISNRNALRRSLGLERVASRMKRRLPEDARLPATLEILVQHHLARQSVGNATASSASGTREDAKPRRPQTARPQAHALAPPRQAAASSGGRTHRARPQSAFAGRTKPFLSVEGASRAPRMQDAPTLGGLASRARDTTMVVEDVDFADLGPDTPPRDACVGAASASAKAHPLEFGASLALTRLLLGPGRASPPPSWRQGLFFAPSSGAGVPYGLVQREGGPCGVIAAAQAFLIDALIDRLPDVARWAGPRGEDMGGCGDHFFSSRSEIPS